MMACTLSGRKLKYVVIYMLSAVNLAIFPKLAVTVHEKRKEPAKKLQNSISFEKNVYFWVKD